MDGTSSMSTGHAPFIMASAMGIYGNGHASRAWERCKRPSLHSFYSRLPTPHILLPTTYDPNGGTSGMVYRCNLDRPLLTRALTRTLTLTCGFVDRDDLDVERLSNRQDSGYVLGFYALVGQLRDVPETSQSVGPSVGGSVGRSVGRSMGRSVGRRWVGRHAYMHPCIHSFSQSGSQLKGVPERHVMGGMGRGAWCMVHGACVRLAIVGVLEFLWSIRRGARSMRRHVVCVWRRFEPDARTASPACETRRCGRRRQTPQAWPPQLCRCRRARASHRRLRHHLALCRRLRRRLRRHLLTRARGSRRSPGQPASQVKSGQVKASKVESTRAESSRVESGRVGSSRVESGRVESSRVKLRSSLGRPAHVRVLTGMPAWACAATYAVAGARVCRWMALRTPVSSSMIFCCCLSRARALSLALPHAQPHRRC